MLIIFFSSKKLNIEEFFFLFNLIIHNLKKHALKYRVAELRERYIQVYSQKKTPLCITKFWKKPYY